MTRETNDQEPIELPSGWSPDKEGGPEWQVIAQLMRDADVPKIPPPEAFEDVYAAIRSQLDEERLSRIPPQAKVIETSNDSRNWVWGILTGGGVGAQALRLAAAAVLGVVLSQNLLKEPALPPMAPERQVTLADASVPKEEPSIPANQVNGTASAVDQIVRGPHSLATSRLALSSFADSIAPAEMQPQNSFGPSSAGYEIDRSGLDEEGNLKSSAQWRDEIQTASSAPGNSWYTYSHFGNPQGRASGITEVSSSPRSNLELLQKLRLHALLNDDQSAFQVVRQLEENLVPEGNQFRQQPQEQALAYLRSGEEMAADGRTESALEAYQKVRQLAPGTFVSFLSQLQTARLNYEVLQDYDEALKGYQVLIEHYPAEYLTPAYKQQVLERIELLAENYIDDWKAVRLWEKSRSLPENEKALVLAELVRTVPQSPLAEKAAQQLSAPNFTQQKTSSEKLAALFEEAIQKVGGTPQSASLQFSKAELIHLRLMDLERARDEYRKVLQMPAHPSLRQQVESRISQLDRMLERE